jgi:hypothetical protein
LKLPKQVRAEVAAPAHARHRTVEDVDHPLGVLAPRVAGHRRLVERDPLAAGLDQPRELVRHDRQQHLGDRPAVGMLDPAGEGVWPGNARLQRRAGRRQLTQPPELLDRPEPARSGQLADQPVLAALVVRGGPQRRRGADSSARPSRYAETTG